MQQAVTILQSRIVFEDPQDCTDNADTLAVYEAVFDALVRRGVDGRFYPALAESWVLSKDARCWTFKLRAGLTFHDGAPLDAAAMRFSIERMQRPDIGATLGAPAVWSQYLGGAVIEAPDVRTLTITTIEPTADLLDLLCAGYALPPYLADAPGFAAKPVGSGAYRVESIAPGEEIRMRANPNWWNGAPANECLIWRCVESSGERAAAVLAGTAQVATRLTPCDAAAIGPQSGTTRVDHIDPTAIIYLLNTKSGPFGDARVRRALNLVVDAQTLVDDVLAGAGQPLSGFISSAHVGYDPSAPANDVDLIEARRLLSDAGFGDGLHLDVDCPTRLPDEAEALTAALADQLAKVGISITVHLVEDRTAYAEQVRAKQIHDMCLFDSSPMSTFRVLNEKIDARTRGAWWQGYHNREIEALLDSSRVTIDPVEREALHRQSFAILRQDPSWLTLYNHVRTVALAGEHSDWAMRADGVLDVTLLPKFDLSD